MPKSNIAEQKHVCAGHEESGINCKSDQEDTVSVRHKRIIQGLRRARAEKKNRVEASGLSSELAVD